jgi:hypothetical protein
MSRFAGTNPSYYLRGRVIAGQTIFTAIPLVDNVGSVKTDSPGPVPASRIGRILI